jgi:short-subunit dehydrogenase
MPSQNEQVLNRKADQVAIARRSDDLNLLTKRLQKGYWISVKLYPIPLRQPLTPSVLN